CATNSGGFGYFISTSLDAFLSTAANSACPRCVPASGQSSPGMIHLISSATNASTPCLSPRPTAAKQSFTIWTFFCVLIEISHFPYIGSCKFQRDSSHTTASFCRFLSQLDLHSPY